MSPARSVIETVLAAKMRAPATVAATQQPFDRARNEGEHIAIRYRQPPECHIAHDDISKRPAVRCELW
jgi:hypothetical protein